MPAEEEKESHSVVVDQAQSEVDILARFSEPAQEQEIDEGLAKRNLFKFAKTNNVREFVKVVELLPPKKVFVKFLSPLKPDPEGKAIIHHVLLNASDQVLQYLID